MTPGLYKKIQSVLTGLWSLGLCSTALAGDLDPFFGEWVETSCDCECLQHDGANFMLVEPGSLAFYENGCDVHQTGSAGAVVTVSATCNDSGEISRETFQLIPKSADVVEVITHSEYGPYVATYKRCRQ